VASAMTHAVPTDDSESHNTAAAGCPVGLHVIWHLSLLCSSFTCCRF